MGRIFCTSDLHLGHNQPFLYESRGYASIEHHDENIVRIWNENVRPDDTVIILGDLMLNNNNGGINKLRRLNGHKMIILGNHDTQAREELYENLWDTEVLGYAMPFRYQGYSFYLSHYPCLVSNYDADKPLKRRTIALAGHNHTKDKWCDWDKGLIYHVEWDAHGKPILLDDIITDIKEKLGE